MSEEEPIIILYSFINHKNTTEGCHKIFFAIFAAILLGFSLFILASLVPLPFRSCCCCWCLWPWLEAVLSVLYCLEVEVVAAVLPRPPPPSPLQPPSAKGVGGDNCSSASAASNSLVVDTDAAAFTFSVGIDRYINLLGKL